MKRYTFEFDIIGTCYTEIEAESLDDAIELMRLGECDYQLDDWSLDRGFSLKEVSNDTIARYLAAENDLE